MNIFWFRRDLRLGDNCGLYHALQARDVLPIFIFDENILSELPKDDRRVNFICELLQKINDSLSKHETSLAIFHGKPEEVIARLIEKHQVSAVFTNHDYEPYARERDQKIALFLRGKNIPFHSFKDQVIFEKDEITKPDGNPYLVFTPYSNKWKEKLEKVPPAAFASENYLSNCIRHSYNFPSLQEIGFSKAKIDVGAGDLSGKLISDYSKTRNFPAMATSRIGPHLRFGSISIRHVVSKSMKSSDKTFLNELIWREFFMQILWHFPDTVTRSFKPKYDRIAWRNNESEFEKWCNGQTGYPIVDAGMRELNATGFMHNRVRMVAASFLCKHLLIDWRWGEAYFALKLNDYEQASNIGNWQWAAGSGVDAAPYFRIFNPSEQARKFDKDLIYIKKWVPELETFDYPEPIADHKEARERCLKVYKQALDV